MSIPCHRCGLFSGYFGPQYIVCAIYPTGPTQDPCPDFAEVIEDWQPLGVILHEGELIKDWPGYLSTAERSEVLENHPNFTGVCPQCGAGFGDSSPIHYDCACGWIDDSIN